MNFSQAISATGQILESLLSSLKKKNKQHPKKHNENTPTTRFFTQ